MSQGLPDLIKLAERYRFELRLHRFDAMENGSPCQHAAWMCDRIPSIVQAGDRSKADRWMGFIQGVLYSQNICTVEDMRKHTRAACSSDVA